MKNRRKKLKRKRVSFLISGLLILGMIPTGSFAANLQDDETHRHTSECYDKVLVCDLVETEAHEHTADCYEITDTLICTKEEHTHNDACYMEERDLVCEDTSEEHEHSEDCYVVSEVLICEQEEHTHDDTCYEKELICSLEENTEAHTHTEECYETILICEKAETELPDENEENIKQPEEQEEEQEPEQEVTEEELAAVDALKTSVEEFLNIYDADREYSAEELDAFAESYYSILSSYQALSPQAQALLSDYAFFWENEEELLDLNDAAVAVVLAADNTETPFDTLKEAIKAVNDGETVLLRQDVTETVDVNGKSFTLDLGGNTVTADTSEGINYVFFFTDGEVTLQNGTVTGGTKGCIRADGTQLTLEDVTVTGNETPTDRNSGEFRTGGGIYITGADAKLVMENCEVSENRADVNTMSSGGGIYCKGISELKIADSVIKNNVVEIDNNTKRGGGIYIKEVGKVEITGSQIIGNTCLQGGGIAVLTASDVTISDSSISENHGTGLWMDGSSVILKGVHVDKNIGIRNTTEGAAVCIYDYKDGSANFQAKNSTFNENSSASSVVKSDCVCDVYNLFQNCEISGNFDIDETIDIYRGGIYFKSSLIEDNHAESVGAISIYGGEWDWMEEDSLGAAYIEDTVIKNNSASSASYVTSSGGICVDYGGRLYLKSGALYNNQLPNSDSGANDLYISTYNTYIEDSISAAQMKDADYDFSDYVWMEKNQNMKIEAAGELGKLTWNNETNKYGFTAMHYVERHVAQIGDIFYTSLQEAVEAAGETDEILLIAGNDDDLGTTFQEACVNITKPVKINMNGRTLKATAKEAFQIAENGSLSLVGDGGIEGKIIQNGELSINGKINQLDITLAQGKTIQAGENFDADAIQITLDDATLAKINTNEQMEDLVLIAGCTKENVAAGITLLGCTNLLVDAAVGDWDIVVKKEVAEGIFLNGVSGDDSNLGTLDKPVKTFARAKELLEGGNKDKIYITGTVTVRGEETWDLAGKPIYRYMTCKDNLVDVEGTLKLENIVIDGLAGRGMMGVKSLIHVGNFHTLEIGEGAVLRYNDVSNGITETDICGGAVFSYGDVVLNNGGKLEHCTAVTGGTVYVHGGSLTMNGGSIEYNTVVTREEGKDIRTAGGAVMVESNGTMTMHDGTIAHNSSEYLGGGISLGAEYTYGVNTKEYGTLSMDGGVIDSNEAYSCGGGIYVQANCEAEIYAGEITNNSSGVGVRHFGGGGIYVNGGFEDTMGMKNGMLHLYNVSISDNTSAMEGGGIAGCLTSNTMIYLTDGGLIYNNTAAGEKYDIRTSNIAHASGAPSPGNPGVYISEYMLGGGNYEWKRTDTGEFIELNKIHEDNVVKIYTDKEDGDAEIEAGKEKVKVVISGNTAEARGGGIGSNGDVVIGTPEETNGTITITKAWDDNDNAYKARPKEISVDIQYGSYTIKNIKLTEENNWTVTLEHMLSKITEQTNAEIKVMELKCEGYSLKDCKAEIDANGVLQISITNEYDTGNLRVSKTVSGKGASQTKDFSFTVTLDDTSIEGRYGEMTFIEGIATFTLKHNESKTASGLPAGVQYQVEESDNSGYTVTVNGADSKTAVGKIEAEKTAEAAFDNYKPGGGGGPGGGPDSTSVTLKAEKLLDGKAPKDDTFVFVLRDEDGSILQKVHNDGKNITFDALKFSEEGRFVYTITEKEGSDDTILYDTTVYKVVIEVTEEDGKYHADVTMKKDGDSYSETPVFENQTKDAEKQSVSVEKVWLDGGNQNRPKMVEVQLLKDGEAYGESIVLNGENGWQHTWNDLEKEAVWTVAEISEFDGYTSAISHKDNVWTITNTIPGNPDDPDTPDDPDDPDTPDTTDIPDDGTPRTDLNISDDGVPRTDLDIPDSFNTPKDSVPQTGDTTKTGVWTAVSICSLAVLIFAAMLEKKLFHTKRRNK